MSIVQFDSFHRGSCVELVFLVIFWCVSLVCIRPVRCFARNLCVRVVGRLCLTVCTIRLFFGRLNLHKPTVRTAKGASVCKIFISETFQGMAKN